MLDPRIYRMGLVPVVLAVIVFAFSLENQQGTLGTNIVPDAFDGSQAYAAMQTLGARYPARRAGSAGDRGLAAYVSRRLRGYGFHVSKDDFQAPTPDGFRSMENVIGVRAGATSRSVVIVSHRDALASPATAGLSGTAVMLELARVLAGQTLNRTLVLVSTTGSVGASGTRRLASELGVPVDAVVVLGDLASAISHGPGVVPWSDGQLVAPTMLRNTVASAVRAQTGQAAGAEGLGGQLAHLAFPMSSTEQVPLVSGGDPAVLLSLSGDGEEAATEATSPTRIAQMGRAVLEATTALEGGQAASAPSSYLLWAGKVIPAWAVRLLVLVLILPVLAVTVDGLARARRKGHLISRWIAWVLAAGLPFLLAGILIVIARLTGWIGEAPPIPLAGGSWPLSAGGIALLVVIGLLFVAGVLWLRPLVIGIFDPRGHEAGSLARAGAQSGGRREPEPQGTAHGAGAAAAVLLVMCLVSLLVWLSNPFAALLLVPALHLWLWVVSPDTRLPAPVSAVLLAVGLAPAALAAAYFATTLGLGPVGVAWNGVLLIAGGGVGFLTVIEWSLLAGCAVSVLAIAVQAARLSREEVEVTVRGPVSYAGPGSLGGTESALRR